MKDETKSWLMLALLALVWGASFILMKRGMHTVTGEVIFSDKQVGALRMFFAGIVLFPIAIRTFKKLNFKKDFLFLCIVGFFGNFIPAFLFTYAETAISSGYAGMLNSCTPIFTVLLGFIIFKVRLTFIQVIGLSIGTVGMILLMLAGNLEPSSGGLSHTFAIVLATFLYGISLNTIKHKLQHYKAYEITALSLSFVLPVAILANWKFDTMTVISSNPHANEGLFYIAILGIVGTAFAVILFNRLISLRDALFASSVTYFIPIVSIFIGFLFLEKINLAQIASVLIVLMGVFFMNYYPVWQKRRRAKEESFEL
jgi:drug/metabolite transporter (DMT)-like permease